MFKKSALLITALLLMLSIPTPCLAADIVLNLSTDNAKVGNDITASGIADPKTWVIIKILDEETNIIFFETVYTDNDGNYNLTFKAPPAPAETILTVVAGYGNQTVTQDLRVNPNTTYYNPNRDRQEKEKEKKQEQEKEEPKSVKIRLTIGQKTAQINNQERQLDVMPLLEADTSRTVVPLRFIGESLNAEVEWIASTRQIVIRDTENIIILWIDSYDTVVNGQRIQTDCPPRILMNNRTFVPLRFINEILGAKVNWNEETREIQITR
jgi:hypothetical protein